MQVSLDISPEKCHEHALKNGWIQKQAKKHRLYVHQILHVQKQLVEISETTAFLPGISKETSSSNPCSIDTWYLLILRTSTMLSLTNKRPFHRFILNSSLSQTFFGIFVSGLPWTIVVPWRSKRHIPKWRQPQAFPHWHSA